MKMKTNNGQAIGQTSVYKKERISGLDLYKLICMFLVITFHFSDHGVIRLDVNAPLTFNWFVLSSALVWGGVCNCAFALISGYFLCKQKFKWMKLIKLYLEVWFYSILCGGISCLLGTDQLSAKLLIKILMPISFDEYWYFSTYVVIVLLSPFFNLIVNRMTKKEHFRLCAAMFVLFSILPTFLHVTWLSDTNFIFSFVLMYFLSAYLRIYHENDFTLTGKYFIYSAICIILCMASTVVLKFVRISPEYFLWNTEKTPVLLTAVILFLGFRRINVKHTKLLNFITPTLFGVYLLQIGRLRKVLYLICFNDAKTFHTPLLLLQMLAAAFTIFAVAVCFDKLRILLLEKPAIRFVNFLYEKLHIQFHQRLTKCKYFLRRIAGGIL